MVWAFKHRTASAVMGCIRTVTLEFNRTISCHQVLSTVNIVIFTGGNFMKKYRTFHMGVIFTILLQFPSYVFYFRVRDFPEEGNIVKNAKITTMRKFPRLKYLVHVFWTYSQRFRDSKH